MVPGAGKPEYGSVGYVPRLVPLRPDGGIVSENAGEDCVPGGSASMDGNHAVWLTPSSDPNDPSRCLEALAAFLDEHRHRGELDGGAGDEWIWMTCTCGAVISRTLEPATA